MCILSIIDSVQTSLEAKFSGGRQGTIPVTPSPEFHSRMGVSGPVLSRAVVAIVHGLCRPYSIGTYT